MGHELDGYLWRQGVSEGVQYLASSTGHILGKVANREEDWGAWRISGVIHHHGLGTYPTEEQAKAAVVTAAIEHALRGPEGDGRL